MEPLVSILIPTNNRPELLLKAVRSALCQSYKNIEIIITDNSIDCTINNNVKAISDWRIFYEKNEANIGPILNWRKALNLARGTYCILLPDDDFFINPFYIEDVVNIAETNKVHLVISNCILGYPSKSAVGSSGHVGLIKGKVFVDNFWDKYSIPTIANLFDRSSALHLNAFNTNDVLYSDIELWLKMMSSERDIYCYPYPSVYYLFHSDNIVTTMTEKSLVANSKFIRPSLGEGVDDNAVRMMVYRYIKFVDGITNAVSISFVKSTYIENNLTKGEYHSFVKVLFFRFVRRLKASAKSLIKRSL